MQDTISLTDLISVQTLQRIQDDFANATGMAALTVDLNGAVTKLSNPTEFCMKLTRGCPKGMERCNQCDLKGGEEAGRTGRPSVYYCHGGLMDFAAPILLGDRQIGSLIGGQVLPQPPDEAKFRRIAREIGVEEEAYIRALRKIKIVPKKTIEASAQLLYTMANALSETGYQKYQTRQLAGQLIGVSADMTEKVQKACECVATITGQNQALIDSMGMLSESTSHSRTEVEKTGEIAKYISNISMQTKLLGFNASVEASRAKEFGAGFNVIAQEIRRLADTTQAQFSQIDKILSAVQKSILDIDGRIENANTVAQTNTSLMEQTAKIIDELNGSAKELARLGKQL